MNRTCAAFLIVILLASCTPPSVSNPIKPPTPLTTTPVLPTSTIIPAPTATARPMATLIAAEKLYAGPGNRGYETLSQLPAGSPVYPIAVFVDFIKVETDDYGSRQQGYLRKDALQNLPSGLPELSIQQIPWISENLDNSFLGDGGFIEKGQIKVVDINGTGTSIDGGGIPLDSAFRLRMQLALSPTTAEYANMQLIGQPYSKVGPWWQGMIRLDVGVNSHNQVQFCFFDGTSENCKNDMQLNVQADQTFTLEFSDPQGKVMEIIDENGKIVTSVEFSKLPGVTLPDGLFPQKKLWLGAWVNPHTNLEINSFTFEKAPDGKWNQTAGAPTLRELAKQKNIALGSELMIWAAREYPYWKILNETDEIVAVSEFGWQGNWYERGKYNFELFDKIVNYAVEKEWTVYGSHLVWGVDRASMPAWLAKSHFTRQEYEDILKEHVQTIAKRYAGRVKIWSIANEAIQRSYGPGGDFWNDVIGPDYIQMSFRWAREVDPHAILIFNGDRNDSPRSADARSYIEKTYAVVKNLKARGVPIDAVGMQMHFFSPWDVPVLPKKDEVIKTMRRFGELGVKIYVTEFSVNLHPLPGNQEEKYKLQADIYRDMLSACLESGVCVAFEYWGLADQWSWEISSLNISNSDPSMFDRNYQPKPAYFAIRDVLTAGFQNTVPATPSP